LAAAVLLLPVLTGVGPAAPALAQDLPPLRGPLDPGATAPAAEQKAKRESELKRVEEALAASTEWRRQLEAEITTLRADQARLTAALIETAEKSRATEDRIRAVELRLQTLTGSETAIRRSLEARRAVVIEVLAALQRIGRRPPPAVLARPEDMLNSVRTAMLLGAVLPELRSETELLAADLAELVRLKAAIAADRETLARDLTGIILEQERIEALTAARQSRLAEAQQSFLTERDRATGLAAQAKTLRDLIEGLEREAGRRPDEPRRPPEGAPREARERFAAAAFRDPGRLSPKTPFSEVRGLVPRPVSGEVVREFGTPDGYGGTTRGVSITTRPGAVVSSPADGWIVFAGPFRSFGRLLIINAGNGYYLLLAGMDHITVEVGQFVLAGEPVATMGQGSSLSPAAGAVETKDPVLYVEFRKDGGSIDPGPWWAKSQSEKVRG
jgi:murein hydrolase activator